MISKISDTCTVLGKLIQKPHIQISFLSYLLRGEKTVLIDTVPAKSTESWGDELAELLPEKKIDALILNHSEEDHSGALSLLLNWIPEVPIYCTAVCRDRLKDTYPNANFICVEDGTSIEIGKFRFRFIHTPGLHWDDNMVTYFENEKILFSNDLFGQYLTCDSLCDEGLSAEEVMSSAIRYFDKVFASSLAEDRKVLAKISKLNFLQIAPGHGVVLKKELQSVLGMYKDRCI